VCNLALRGEAWRRFPPSSLCHKTVRETISLSTTSPLSATLLPRVAALARSAYPILMLPYMASAVPGWSKSTLRCCRDTPPPSPLESRRYWYTRAVHGCRAAYQGAYHFLVRLPSGSMANSNNTCPQSTLSVAGRASILPKKEC